MSRPIAISTGQTWPYVLEDNRNDPREDQVIWHLRALSRKQNEKISNMLTTTADGNAMIMLGSRNWYTVEVGLADVENWTDGDGSPVEVEFTNGKKDHLNDSFMNRLSRSIVDELAQAIYDGNRLTVEDEKKPEPPLT